VPSIPKEITRKKKWAVEYPNIPLAIRPVRHCEDLPISEPPVSFSLDLDEEEENTPEETPRPSTSRDPKFLIRT
jgi:hypothetical protein